MHTLTINSKSAQARSFLQYAQSLPFVRVESDECPICKAADYRLRPDVIEGIERSARGEDRVAFNSLEEMFADVLS